MTTVTQILRAFLIACSFLTVLPVPRLEWPKDGTKFLCLVLWAVGAVLGCIWTGVAFALSRWNAGTTLRGVIMALAVLALTGGLHMDGLMDTSDAIFSRRDRETRLKILTDSHAGSFAVMSCVAVLLLQSAAFASAFENCLFSRPHMLIALAAIPMNSRLGMGLLLNTLPYARHGMTQALAGNQGLNQDKTLYSTVILVMISLLLTGVNFWAIGLHGLLLMAIWFIFLLLWRYCCVSVFGGIAGDLLGAFNEISETVLLIVLCVHNP